MVLIKTLQGFDLTLSGEGFAYDQDITIYKGTIKEGHRPVKYKVIRIFSNKKALIERMVKRFTNSCSGDKRHLIKLEKHLKGCGYDYFCVEYSDHTLQDFNCQDEQIWKTVIQGFITALLSLHKSGNIHGEINMQNLVIRRNIGYLGGGIDCPKPTKDTSKEKQKDIECLFKAIQQCFQRNNMSIPHKLAHIFRLWKIQNKELTRIQHHPYLLSPTGVRNFYYSSWDYLASTKRLDRGHICSIFAKSKVANKHRSDYSWDTMVNKTDGEFSDIFWRFLWNSDVEAYEGNEWSFLRFCRNAFAHIHKGSQGSLPPHYHGIQKILEKIYVNFDCILFETLFELGLLGAVFEE